MSYEAPEHCDYCQCDRETYFEAQRQYEFEHEHYELDDDQEDDWF
jgi:hypothetical protein